MDVQGWIKRRLKGKTSQERAAGDPSQEPLQQMRAKGKGTSFNINDEVVFKALWFMEHINTRVNEYCSNGSSNQKDDTKNPTMPIKAVDNIYKNVSLFYKRLGGSSSEIDKTALHARFGKDYAAGNCETQAAIFFEQFIKYGRDFVPEGTRIQSVDMRRGGRLRHRFCVVTLPNGVKLAGDPWPSKRSQACLLRHHYYGKHEKKLKEHASYQFSNVKNNDIVKNVFEKVKELNVKIDAEKSPCIESPSKKEKKEHYKKWGFTFDRYSINKKKFGEFIEYGYITPTGVPKSHFTEAENFSDLDETRSIAEAFEQYNPYADNPDGTRNTPLKMSRRGSIRVQKQSIGQEGQSVTAEMEITPNPPAKDPSYRRPVLEGLSESPLRTEKKLRILRLPSAFNVLRLRGNKARDNAAPTQSTTRGEH